MGVLDEGAGEELDDRSRYAFWQPGLYGSDDRWGQDQFVGLAHERRARTASTPRTTSPAAKAASASRMSARASGSLSTASVSSSSARSTGLMMTATGRPLRVTVTRSCSCSTRSMTSLKWLRTSRRGSTDMYTIVALLWRPRKQDECALSSVSASLSWVPVSGATGLTLPGARVTREDLTL